jgi:hypothetical protein
MHKLEKLQLKLNQHLEDPEPGSIILVKVPPHKSIWFTVAMMNVLLNKRMLTGVYVSLGKPHLMVKTAMTYNGYDISNLVFIDTVSKLGTREVPGKRVIFLDGPYHLELLLDTISKGFLEDNEILNVPMDLITFFYMDNLDEVLVYNETTKIVHFLRNYANLIERYKKIGIITCYTMNNPVVEAFRDEVGWIFEAQEDWF